MSGVDSPALMEPPHHQILTERLKLRTLRVSDAERLMPILTSKAVMQWTVHLLCRPRMPSETSADSIQTKPPVKDILQAERWIKDRALGQDVFNFIIDLRDSEDGGSESPIVGVAGTFHVPKIGYLIHPAYWGKGIASEALSALVPAIFTRFPSTQDVADGGRDVTTLDYMEGWIDIDNAASRRVLEKCGFVLCEEMDAPSDAPGYVSRVAALRRAREGMSLEGMGLVKVEDGEGERPIPPVE